MLIMQTQQKIQTEEFLTRCAARRFSVQTDPTAQRETQEKSKIQKNLNVIN